jgi:hypothetical protein
MIFYEVYRRGRRYGARNLKNYGAFGRKLVETDNRERAERTFKKEAEKLRNGSVYLLADGHAERAVHGDFMRTRW